MRRTPLIAPIVSLWACCLLLAGVAAAQEGGEALPETWHVGRDLYPKAYGILANEKIMYPMDMSNWPVKIDTARQLFVDDYLIAEMTDLEREVHQVTKHPANPLLTGDVPWEQTEDGARRGLVFQIVRRDEETGLFRMWYAAYVVYSLPGVPRVRFPACYAESTDGITWKRPELGLYEFQGSKANNIVIPAGNAFGLFIEPQDPGPDRRYKAVVWHEPEYVPREGYFLYTSPDGIHWTRDSEAPLAVSLNGYTMPQSGIGDTSIFRWDRLLGRYVCDTKFVLPGKFRCRAFMESDDLIHWTRPRMTVYPDALDHPDSQIYGQLSFCYESMWLAFLRVMHTHVGWKQTTVELTCSRDGRHWSRVGNREEVIPLGPRDAWDADYHDPCWDPILVGDELWIYYRSVNRQPAEGAEDFGHAIGLATLRRDGFVSLNAGTTPGSVTTRPLTVPGTSLLVNAEVAEEGYVKAALLSPDGEVLDGYSLEESAALTDDTIRGDLAWAGAPALPVVEQADHLRIRFEMKNAKLYSFWIE